MLPKINNPERGCGQLKEGGFYARSDVAPGGALAVWSWCLGEMVIGKRNLNLTAPPRQIQVIRLRDSLVERRSMTDRSDRSIAVPLTRLPSIALIDHVGAMYYSPNQFAEEVKLVGPSRRIPQNIAEAIVDYTPIPILFSHSHLPVVDLEYREVLQAWAMADSELDYDYFMTCDDPNWGLESSDWHGSDHWSIPVLQAMDDHRGKHLTKAMPPELAENVLLEEQAFGISWINRIIYVANSSDSDSKIETLLGKGIEPVVLED